jgi:hypothetical protein
VTRWGRALAAGSLALCLLGAAPAAVADDGAYAASVDRALQLLRDPAPGGEAEAAHRAADALAGEVGDDQREIVADLRAEPPRVADARARLTALSVAAHAPAFTPEPARADRAIHDILAQQRYAALRQGPSLGDRIGAWLLGQLARLLDLVGGNGDILPALELAGALLLLVAGFVLARATFGGPRREARLRRVSGDGSAARDRFAEADRLAAAGDLAAAVRELAGGVAAALGDERDWEFSPLTVREIFGRAPRPEALRPLLHVFEEAVYGGRPPDAAAYASASAAAAPFRRPAGAGPRERAA